MNCLKQKLNFFFLCSYTVVLVQKIYVLTYVAKIKFLSAGSYSLPSFQDGIFAL